MNKRQYFKAIDVTINNSHQDACTYIHAFINRANRMDAEEFESAILYRCREIYQPSRDPGAEKWAWRRNSDTREQARYARVACVYALPDNQDYELRQQLRFVEEWLKR